MIPESIQILNVFIYIVKLIIYINTKRINILTHVYYVRNYVNVRIFFTFHLQHLIMFEHVFFLNKRLNNKIKLKKCLFY